MKLVSNVLIILGIVGVVVFGIQAINQSESFNFLGMKVAVSKADWTPTIASAVVLVVGVILGLVRKK